MPVPLQPPAASTARPYPSSMAGIPTRMLKHPPPKEGEKILPLYFTFERLAAQTVDFGLQQQAPMSQLCSLWVDATNSTHDIIVYFPDTNVSLHVAFGKSKMLPAITGVNVPKFIVLLDDNGDTNATDTCSITCFNFYQPGFDSSSFLEYLSYGYASNFELQPTFTQSTFFQEAIQKVPGDGQVGTINVTIIPKDLWYITYQNLNFQIGSIPVGHLIQVSLVDGVTDIFNSGFFIGSETNTGIMSDVGGLNYKSLGGGNLILAINGVLDTDGFTVNANFFGGTLSST